jgi:hypothetical protein
MLLRTLQEMMVLGVRSAWSDDEVQIWLYSACRRDAPCGMRGILERARVDYYYYYYNDYALQRLFLRVGSSD